MANHEKFQALSLPERWIANGKMQHAYANSPKFFEKLNKLIEQAEKDGVYADVKFLPGNSDSGQGGRHSPPVIAAENEGVKRG